MVKKLSFPSTVLTILKAIPCQMCIYWLSNIDFQFCQPKFGAIPILQEGPWSTNGALRAQNLSKSTAACREIERYQIFLLTLFLGYPFGHLSLERVPKRLGQPQRCLCTESVEELRRTCWQTNLPQRCRDLNKGRRIKDSESNASYFVCSCNAFVKSGP